MLLPALALSSAFLAPHAASRALSTSKVAMNGGKGFGGGEATRDPAPTVIDPNDPQGKQQAIHKAESFAEYLAKRSEAGGGGAAAAGEATRDSAPWPADPPPPPAAPPAYAPPAAAAPTAEGGSAYDPWKDPALIEVTFMVDGVPKKYRIAQ